MRCRSLRAKSLLFLFFISLLLTTVGAVSILAADELFLTGVVSSIDYDKKLAAVKVLSATCRGEREFSSDNPAELTEFVGKKINFSIDSSTCSNNDRTVHTMYLNGRTWR